MNNAATALPTDKSETAASWGLLDEIATDYVTPWLRSCREFLNWHRENLVRREPTAEIVKMNDRVHPWMIRATRLMHCQMLDPEFAHRDLARAVEATLWQLEEAWAQTHNPMGEADADALIASVFPAHAS